ncbi:MAG: ABC transporter permease [Wenzhouxiangellaceae bacterium]|nr:ABC transporter permease [Wenzhouxiangellaceae bacterium]MBS3746857.1 ABC transporter permease [Wenzhouxiangellaceae bacterium]MBS3824137.1 ABC transporter permease [Wenzhouxiangellaceae bacterium]
MIPTVAKVMWLAVWRDRGALMLAFVLPPLMFLVFAEVFSGAGDSDLEMRVALHDSAQTPLTGQIVAALAELDGIEPVAHETEPDRSDAGGLEALVRQARVDAAVWVRAEPDGNLDAEPAIVVIGDASRRLAAAIVTGRVQRLLQAEFPELGVQRAAALVDALAGPYTEQQRKALDLALSELDSAGLEEETGEDTSQDGLVAQRLLGGGRQIDDGVSYYAGAVAILFLLFAAMQGAISLIDERNSGIVDRLVAGPGGYTVVVVGKGLFLTLQGLAQAGLIFAVAWWMYGIDWPGRFGLWLVTACLAAAVSAWLGLLLASLCRTRQQAQTASAFVVLILSAIGGSMMPRFLMPGWLRELGWFTPNAWVIESWHGIFWRGNGPAELVQGWAVLLATALAAMLLSIWLAHRLAREK